MGHIGGSQLCEENILSALDQAAVHHHGTAHRRLPEGQVKHVVQAEGNQRPLHNPENQGSHISGARHQSAQCENSVLHHRPHKIHQNPHKHVGNGRNDRHEPGTSEEGQRIWQHDLVIPVVQRRHAKAHDNTAEHAHLQGLNPQNTGDGPLQHSLGHRAVRQHLAGVLKHCVNGNVHDQEGDHRGEGRHLLLGLCHADGYAHGKDNRQVVEDHAARLAHDGEQAVKQGSVSQERLQSIGCDGRRIGEGAADAQQKPRHRKNRDGQHKASSHPL